MSSEFRAEDPLPDYANPPVVEVILGVQFDGLAGFRNAHLGAFWKSLDTDEWPSATDAAPLEPQFERFAESDRWTKAAVQRVLTQNLPNRVQVKNKRGDRLIQLQNGCFHVNWLGTADGTYPRYDKVRDGFVDALRQLRAFLDSEKLGEFRPNQWEVTYLNHIPRGSVWNTPADWGFFRPLTPMLTVEGLVQGESFGGEWHFIIPEQRGRLHVAWQHGRRSEPKGQELVVLALTARGPLDPDIQALLAGLDLGRATIVQAFKIFMTDEANKHWGLTDVSY